MSKNDDLGAMSAEELKEELRNLIGVIQNGIRRQFLARAAAWAIYEDLPVSHFPPTAIYAANLIREEARRAARNDPMLDMAPPGEDVIFYRWVYENISASSEEMQEKYSEIWTVDEEPG